MKKMLILFVAALMLSTTATFAQKVDAEAMKAKLEKVDADSQNAKKGLKASTWISRGDAYVEALTAPTKALFIGMDRASLGVLTGKTNVKSSGTETLGGRTFNVYQYPFFTAYIVDGKVVTWKEKNAIYPDAAAEAIKSYEKAVSLDSGATNKAKAGLQALVDYYKMQGNLALDLFDMKGGAADYMQVAEIQANPIYNNVEPSVLFYAGYMYTIAAEPAAYKQGEVALNKAVDSGYDALEDADTLVVDSERGNIYYYLFHCAYGLRDENPEKIQDAKKYLEIGLTKYPQNEKIFEGLLQLYTSGDGVGDPKELLSTVEKNVEAKPNDANAWFGRGRIYFALKDYDECIKSFAKVTEIDPTMFDGFYYLGFFYMLKGDDFVQQMNKNSYTDQASYDKDVEKLSEFYGSAIPAFEKAHELNPTEKSTVEYLKQLCFRLRDQPGIMDKYNKYNELYKTM